MIEAQLIESARLHFFPGIKKCNSTKLTFYNNIHFSIFHTKKNELKILSLKHLDGTSVLNNTCNK